VEDEAGVAAGRGTEDEVGAEDEAVAEAAAADDDEECAGRLQEAHFQARQTSGSVGARLLRRP
jgi:hypothetical protein